MKTEKPQNIVTIESLHIYPIKSCAGLEVERVCLGERGPEGDREWMLVTPDGDMVTARKHPELLKVIPTPWRGGVWLQAPRMKDTWISFPEQTDAPVMNVQIWRDELAQVPVSEAGSAWFSDYLGRPVKLVWMAPHVQRPVDPQFVSNPRQVGFADGFPLLLVNQASLEDLSKRVGRDLDMKRFRPNITVRAESAWVEDRWHRLWAGELALELVKPCSRCVMITTDPQTLERSPEILSVLGRFRKNEWGICFGHNVVHTGPGVLARGQAFTIEV
jgi:hypothetical protein